MKIGAIVHMYPPRHNAGAEWYLHHTLRWLKTRGHTVSVWVDRLREHSHVEARFQGIDLVNYTPARYASQHDVILTHLDMTSVAIQAAAAAGKPLAHLVHNHRQLATGGVTQATAQLVVFNSRWLCVEVGWSGRQIVVPPPVPPADYRTDPGRDRDAITLVNLSHEKGVETFAEVARLLPERRFIGVLGAYNVQQRDLPANVEVRVSTPRMRSVYQDTRLLLIPSVYESYGRVGLEGGWSGIPSVYHPTKGLMESIGSAGLICARGIAPCWLGAIKLMDDPERYKLLSAEALRNSEAKWKQTQSALVALEKALQEVAG